MQILTSSLAVYVCWGASHVFSAQGIQLLIAFDMTRNNAGLITVSTNKLPLHQCGLWRMSLRIGAPHCWRAATRNCWKNKQCEKQHVNGRTAIAIPDGFWESNHIDTLFKWTVCICYLLSAWSLCIASVIEKRITVLTFLFTRSFNDDHNFSDCASKYRTLSTR
jgi:hypothetical protein